MRTSIFSFAILAILSLSGARAANVIAVASGNWSSAATWGGALPGVEDTVKIPTGLTVTLNANVECGGIVVEGRLEVERANRTLLCDYLIVQTAGAVFQVGTSASRFLQTFTLTLKGLSTETAPVMGAKVLGAHNGGTLDIHGRDRIEWTHLGVNAAAGATSLTLVEPVDWAVGDSILVTSSRANWNEAETLAITAVSPDQRTVSFAAPLAYPHNGSTITKTRSTDGKSWTGDLRAEVGLLSRNVKIQGDAVSETAGFGGHMMVMDGGPTCCLSVGKGYIEGVELFRMGQKSAVGRYPMHWHMLASGGVGQYFRDSVVRHSFNRAITIHGTESTLVENNFCYDHLGHGIFLEDGSERFNVIRRNVVVLSKKPAPGEQILDTDNGFDEGQNRSPSSFWITDPNNTFTDNVAAGTEGTGYWFAFPQKPLGASLTHPSFAGLEPSKQPLGAFDRNTAHSCKMGLDIVDQVSSTGTLVKNGSWENNGPFYFNDCTWYCNYSAIYAGGGDRRKNVVYRNNVFSDNEINLFLATYQLCEESLMVADSGFGLQPSNMLRFAYLVYDGAGLMKKNHLVGWDATNARFLQNIGAAVKHPNHYFESLTFDPPTPVRSELVNYNFIPPANIGGNDPGHPRIWAQVIVDVDGSISGVPNSSIISNHPFMLTGGETRPSVWTNMYRSDHRFAQCRLEYGLPNDTNPNVSVVRTKAGTPTRGVYYINGYKEWHQLPLIVREDFLYTYSYEALPSTKKVIVNFDDAVVGDDFVVRFKDFGKLLGIAVTGTTSRSSLAALKAGTTSGYYREINGDLYIRPVATTSLSTYTITWTINITMPTVDSDGDGISDGAEAAAGTDPFRTVNGTDPFVNSEFDVPGNFEAWGSFYGIGSETVAGGVLSAQSTNGDPQMFAENLRVDGTAVPYLLVRMKASQNGPAQFSWGRLGASGYSSSRIISANYSGNGDWQVVSFPMANSSEWRGQIITNLRFDPVATSGVNFQIDYIRASNVVTNATWLGGTGNWNDNSRWSGAQFTGTFATINDGQVNFANNDTFGDASTTTSANISLNGGTLASNGWFTTIWNLNLNGGTLLANGGASLDYPAFQLAGTVTVGGSQASTIAATTAINANNQISIGGNGNTTLAFNVGDATGNANADLVINATLQNSVFGAGSLTKSGAGTLLLNGVNTYTGTTSVTAGILNVNGSIASSGPISIAAGATLNAAGYNTLPNGNWTIVGTLNKTDAAIQDISNSITLNNGTISGATDNSDWGTFNLFGGPTITANGSTNTINAARLGLYNGVTIATPNSGDALTISSILGAANSSGGSLTKTGSGTLALNGTNIYTGTTIINNGTLALGNDYDNTENGNSLGSGVVTVAGGSQLRLGGAAGGRVDYFIGNAITLDNGTIYGNDGYQHLTGGLTIAAGGGSLYVQWGGKDISLEGAVTGPGTLAINNTPSFGNGTVVFTLGGTIGGLTGSGVVVISGAQTLAVGSNGANTTFDGVLSGGGGFTKTGGGTQTLTGANTFSGGTTVSGGVLNLSGSLASSVTVSGGAFAPLGAPSAASGITLGSGGTFRVRINGAGVGYDQLTVGGNVTLNGALDLLAAPGLAPGTAFKIVNKTSAGAIGGTFSGKPEGSAFAAAGYVWLVTYSGGDGNDVLLTLATPVQSWRFTYFGTTANTGAAADLSDPNNDGENNFLEFATGQNPNAAIRAAIGLVKNGATLEFTYTRSLAAMSDGVTFTVEWSDTLANDWSTAGVSSPSVLSNNGTTQQIKVSVPAGNGVTRRFVRLKLMRP